MFRKDVVDGIQQFQFLVHIPDSILALLGYTCQVEYVEESVSREKSGLFTIGIFQGSNAFQR